MRKQRYQVAFRDINEIAQITSEIQALERRARDLEISDLAHLLGVAQIAANDWVNKKLDEVGEPPVG